jgi:hypothetical protein
MRYEHRPKTARSATIDNTPKIRIALGLIQSKRARE